MPRTKDIKRINLILYGSALALIFGVILLSLIFYPVAQEEIRYYAKQLQNVPVKEQAIEPIDKEFGIVVPKINANAKVIKNVNTRDESAYQRALTKGVAHARGSSFPNEAGNVFLFAHSSDNFYNANRYNSVFYLLTKLEKGDDILLYFDEEKYAYRVDAKRIVNPESVAYMSGVAKSKKLTLMTCWPPGTTLKRLIIEASPVE